MANREHVQKLKEGATAWNAWREDQDDIEPDFSYAELIGADLSGSYLANVNLSYADLHYANLTGAELQWADLSEADLSDANLTDADLTAADLESTNLYSTTLVNASLRGAGLERALFSHANLNGSDLSRAALFETIFVNTDFSTAIGLHTCRHYGPSFIDIPSLQRSGSLPLEFLRGIGLPDIMIQYLPSIFGEPIQHYSCFISFSTADEDFVVRLHADLQDNGVRCWFAPHDMPIGGDVRDEIDFAIRLRDKLLVVISERSIQSPWVKEEVTKALEEERLRNQKVLFPVRLDDSFKGAKEPWAATLRARHIGDFTRWKEHDEYQKSFARVLRDLTVKRDAP